MDFELRLKALASLATSQTDAATAALGQALQKARASLRDDTRYDLLEQSLEVIETIGHRFPEEASAAIIAFISALKSRQLTYSSELSAFSSDTATYQNASTLAVRGIEVLLRFRYLETRRVTQALLQLSVDEDKDICSKAIEGLKNVAAYNRDVFYGRDSQSGIGGHPQKQVLDLLLALRDEELVELQSAVLAIAENLLSPTIEGTRWSSTTLTISHQAAPAGGGVVDIRGDTIRLLKRLYWLVNGIPRKLSVIGVLNDATRPHRVPTGGDEVAAMIVRNTQDVLDFFGGLVGTADFQIVQKIEALSYWIFYHAPNEQVKRYALAIEKAVAANDEYQIYKTLIGFEGIFVSWERLRENDSYWEETDKFRKDKATEFSSSITAATFPAWRDRILAYTRTQSDDMATFPIFFYFLQTFAETQPKLAVKLLSDDTNEIAGFLIPLLRGLWKTPEQPAVRKLVDEWIKTGQHLYASTKQLLDCPTLDRTLVRRLLDRDAEVNDLQTVALVMSVAASNYRDDDSIVDELFIPALEILTDRGSPHWIFDLWFRREARVVISNLDGHGTNLILRNLALLEEIDYHAEEILYVIAQRMPEKVIEFFCQRLSEEKHGEKKRRTYDAIPYRLHKLNVPLAAIPKEAVRIVRAQYDGDFGMFVFRGARLLKTIFPEFSAGLENELLSLVDEGGDENLEFVLAVLRNYEGQTFIHKVCKAIVKTVPAESQLRTEVSIALQNTGVVSGAYGFVEAYERKKVEMQDWLTDPSDVIREFGARYVEGLNHMIAAERQRADEQIALRKQRFDE